MTYEPTGNRTTDTESRIVYRTVDLGTLPEEDARFYREDATKARAWENAAPNVREYRQRYVCGEIVVIDCMDERQANTPETLGLPLGVYTPVRSAGNKLGEHNRSVESEVLRVFKRQRRAEANPVAKRQTFYENGELRPVMVLYVTHSSWSRPNDDSCAAWGHDTAKARAEATRQVERMNREYTIFDQDSNLLRRFVVAFHLHSLTDTEANIWHGQDVRLNPMDYIASPDSHPERVAMIKEVLGADINERFRTAFPQTDPRFSGLSHACYEDVIRQIADMFENNVNMVRKIAVREAEASKQGHQGRRVLVGRGWEAHDETYEHSSANFTISDFTDLDRDLGIAGKYVLANSILDASRHAGGNIGVPFHVNVLYGGWDEVNREMDRCVSSRLGMGLGREILMKWRDISSDVSRRMNFRNDVAHVLAQKGGDTKAMNMLDALCANPEVLLQAFRVYVSVSYHDTHALELIATTQDVANS